jgi:FixJ family two-component response regulator
MAEPPVVFIVDDDQAVRDTLQRLVESINLRVETYASPKHYLDAFDANRPGCLVLDYRMPGMSGLELHQTLVSRGNTLPTIIITGFGDVTSAVQAMKQGVVDFVEKPFHNEKLLEVIQRCIRRDAQSRHAVAARSEIQNKLSSLTRREQEVLDLVVSGKSNKETAKLLDISPKTVEVHRSHLMDKMDVTSLANLVQIITTFDNDEGNS